MTSTNVCVCAWSLLAATALAAPPRDLITINASPSQATFASAAADGSWSFKSEGDKSRTVRADDIVQWGDPAEYPHGPVIFLADGGIIAQSPVETGQGPVMLRIVHDRLEIDRSAFGRLSLPLETIRGVMFHPPSDRQDRDRLARRIERDRKDPSAPRTGDLLVLDNGDELSGAVEMCDGKQVHLTSDVGKVQIDVMKLAALAFDPALLAKPSERGSRTIVGLANGSRIVSQPFTASSDAAQVSPLIFAGKQPAWSTPLDSLVFLQPLGGRVTYLSDLDAASYKHIPYLTLAWPYHDDLNVTGTQLRAGGRLYAKGLGMHSASRLTYRLDKSYRRFEAEVAIDDSTHGGGSVGCRVFLDEQQVWASDTVRGGMPPVPVTVDLKGGKQLSLIVDFAERADELDHVDWLNARLVE